MQCHLCLKQYGLQPQGDSVSFIRWAEVELDETTSMKSLPKHVFRHQHYSIEDLIACPDLPALLEWGEFRLHLGSFYSAQIYFQVFETRL